MGKNMPSQHPHEKTHKSRTPQRVRLPTQTRPQRRTRYSLFLDRIRLAHLRTERAVEAEAHDPRALPIPHLTQPRLALGRVDVLHRRAPVQVQVRRHPVSHDKRRRKKKSCQLPFSSCAMYGWGSVGKAGQIEYCVRVLSRVTGTTTQQSSEDHADRVRGPLEHREPPK